MDYLLCVQGKGSPLLLIFNLIPRFCQFTDICSIFIHIVYRNNAFRARKNPVRTRLFPNKRKWIIRKRKNPGGEPGRFLFMRGEIVSV